MNTRRDARLPSRPPSSRSHSSDLSDITRLEDRPKLFGAFGAVFGICSIAGPLLGGAFTDHVSWRWCFYINLPVGAITIASIVLIIPASPSVSLSDENFGSIQKSWRTVTGGRWAPKRKESYLTKVLSLDWVGAVLILGVVTTLLLPLQWGGDKYAWNDRIIIALFCTFGVLTVLFVLWQWKGVRKGGALLPLDYFKNRTVTGCSLLAALTFLGLMLGAYYLPIFYEAARGHSATKAGIDILPFMLSVVVMSMIGGIAISKFGYYWPFIFVGPMVTSVGAGLLYTLKADSGSGANIGYQILLGIGVGAVMQNTIIALQANVKVHEIPQASACVTFFQLIGGTIGISIANTVFGNILGPLLIEYAPEAPYDLVRRSVEAIPSLPEPVKAGVIRAYVEALDKTYLIGVPAGFLGACVALLVKNTNIKGKGIGPGAHA